MAASQSSHPLSRLWQSVLGQGIPGPIVRFLLQITPVLGYLVYHHFGRNSLDRMFGDGMTHERALVNLGLLLPWLTQIAVINTCQNHGYPGRKDTLLQDIIGIARSLMFYSLPILVLLMAVAVTQLDWPLPIAFKFIGLMLVNLMMSITFVIMSIHHLWRSWFFGNLLYIALLFVVPYSIFVAPVLTFCYGLAVIRFGRSLPFRYEIISEWHAGMFGLCLGSILWLDKILWWFSGSVLIHSGSIFVLIIPGILITAVYFSFFAVDLGNRVDYLYVRSKELSVTGYMELVDTMRVYFRELSLCLISLALILFLVVVSILETQEVHYGPFHFAWLSAILCQSLALVYALILNTLLGKEPVVRIARVYSGVLVAAFLVLPEPLMLGVQVIASFVLLIAFWLECRNSVTHPIEIAFINNVHNP